MALVPGNLPVLPHHRCLLWDHSCEPGIRGAPRSSPDLLSLPSALGQISFPPPSASQVVSTAWGWHPLTSAHQHPSTQVPCHMSCTLEGRVRELLQNSTLAGDVTMVFTGFSFSLLTQIQGTSHTLAVAKPTNLVWLRH